MHYLGGTMKTDEKHSPTHHCACHHEDGQCQGNYEHTTAINRRRFLAVGSGCCPWRIGRLKPARPTAKRNWWISERLTRFSEEGISEEFTKDNFFVIRYQDRLFAASTTCPHMGNPLQRDPQDVKRITCGIHGSVFDGEGVATVGPASSGLIRLGITVNKEGHVMVNPVKEFPQDKWTDKACYVEVK